jgi:IclR family transcriptional regulator, pca regulon regulatory protein
MISRQGNSSYHSESLARGLTVIRAFSHDFPRLRAIEVARRAGLSRAAARRYLLTLRDLGYVGSESDMFYLRPRLLDLGFSYLSSIGVEDVVQPVLSRISERTQASSTFAVLDRDEVVFVARAPTKGIFMLSTSIGGRVAAHATTLGQVMLAGMPPAELDRYLAETKRVAFTKWTITDAAALRRKLDRVRAEGYALSHSEQYEGIVAVAVPVHNQRGDVVAAVNINMYPANAGKIKVAKKHVATLREEVRELEAAMYANNFLLSGAEPRRTTPAKTTRSTSGID